MFCHSFLCLRTQCCSPFTYKEWFVRPAVGAPAPPWRSRPVVLPRLRSCAIRAFPALLLAQISFLLLISRQGKVRLSKFYETVPAKERTKLLREVTALVLSRPAKQCNFVEYKDSKIVYKR
jgi:hypothetical protein